MIVIIEVGTRVLVGVVNGVRVGVLVGGGMKGVLVGVGVVVTVGVAVIVGVFVIVGV